MFKKLVLGVVSICILTGCVSSIKKSKPGIRKEEAIIEKSQGKYEIPYYPYFKLIDSVYFDYDKASPKSSDILSELVVKYQGSSYQFKLEGYCCECGTEQYNLCLSERRVNSVKTYLTVCGILESDISVVSYGEENSKYKNVGPPDSEKCKENRRVDIYIKEIMGCGR